MERSQGQGSVSTPTSIITPITPTPGFSATPVPACPPRIPFSPPGSSSSSSLGRLTYAQDAAKSITPTRTNSLKSNITSISPKANTSIFPEPNTSISPKPNTTPTSPKPNISPITSNGQIRTAVSKTPDTRPPRPISRVPANLTAPTPVPVTSTTILNSRRRTDSTSSSTNAISASASSTPSFHPSRGAMSSAAVTTSKLPSLTYAQVAAKCITSTSTMSLLQGRPVSADCRPQTQECAARCPSCSAETLMPKIAGLEEYIALDCEMYYTDRGISLGRVTVVDHTGYILCDVFVRPKAGERIVNYCTEKSGIRPIDIEKFGKNFDDVRTFVARLIEDKVLVIHDRVHDFKVLELDHPRHLTRDTATALHLIRRVRDARDTRPLGKVGLKTLASALLGRSIQEGEHCSLVDARVTMAVYRQVHQDWRVGPEHELPPPQPRTKHRHGKNKKGQQSRNNLRQLQLSAVRSWRGETAVDYYGNQVTIK